MMRKRICKAAGLSLRTPMTSSLLILWSHDLHPCKPQLTYYIALVHTCLLLCYNARHLA